MTDMDGTKSKTLDSRNITEKLFELNNRLLAVADSLSEGIPVQRRTPLKGYMLPAFVKGYRTLNSV